MATTGRPDIVYISYNTVVLIELTIPFNSPDNLNKAQTWKQQNMIYQQLSSDLDARPLSPLMPLRHS